jgi:hypothetical protein
MVDRHSIGDGLVPRIVDKVFGSVADNDTRTICIDCGSSNCASVRHFYFVFYQILVTRHYCTFAGILFLGSIHRQYIFVVTGKNWYLSRVLKCSRSNFLPNIHRISIVYLSSHYFQEKSILVYNSDGGGDSACSTKFLFSPKDVSELESLYSIRWNIDLLLPRVFLHFDTRSAFAPCPSNANVLDQFRLPPAKFRNIRSLFLYILFSQRVEERFGRVLELS